MCLLCNTVAKRIHLEPIFDCFLFFTIFFFFHVNQAPLKIFHGPRTLKRIILGIFSFDIIGIAFTVSIQVS